MSVAYYIELDIDEPDFDTEVDGKALARNSDRIEALCEQLGLTPLQAFMGMSGDDIADLLDEDIDQAEAIEETWFTPDAGLAVVNALSAHIRANPDAVTHTKGVLEDLAGYAEVLQQASAVGARWHLALDF